MSTSSTRVILLHGGGVGPWMWRPQLPALRGRYVVHTPTLPGHDPHSTAEFLDHRRAAESVAHQVDLANLDGRVIIVGFSLGGQTAIEFAARHPDRIDALVVQSSLVEPMRGGRAYARVAGALMPLARNRSFARAQAKQLLLPPDMFDRYLELSRAMTARSLHALSVANFTFTVPDAVAEHPRPTLLIYGSREPALLQRGMAAWGSRLLNGRVVRFDGVGHGASLAIPEEFTTTLVDFIDSTA